MTDFPSYPDNAALRQVLEQARDFIDPDRDPPRINNRKLVMKINAVLSRVDAQGAWMPIESAPKPNVDVMLWYPWASAPCKGAPAGFRYIARWTGTDSGEDCWRDPVDFEPIGDAPTHWQPLPDGPSVPSTMRRGPCEVCGQPADLCMSSLSGSKWICVMCGDDPDSPLVDASSEDGK